MITHVISLGGSVISPDGPDAPAIAAFVGLITRLAKYARLVVICGGGSTSRRYIAAAKQAGVKQSTDLDWTGIAATKLNAELVRAVLAARAPRIMHRVTIEAGRSPGATTDYVAVLMARRHGARMVWNVTNVDGVFTADPRKQKAARLIDTMSWKDYRKKFTSLFRPGIHVPFDPLAARLAEQSGIQVMMVSSNVRNLKRAFFGRSFRGTVIGT